jgi:serine/threonine protein kinase
VIGSVLGKYRIEAELSRGGMGAVYRARHEILERPVAVKLLRPELTTNASLVTRFLNEARAASAIKHPGIIEVFDFGHTDEGLAYLVMELLDGEPLSARITARGKLAEAEAIAIMRGIAGALAAAHAQGIVHRDLKPDNIFLVPDPELGERAKILDFGIAKLADLADGGRQTQTGTLMGTPLYMAPEQARAAKDIDHRADLYSLGCIFYELVTGRPPFVAEGAGELIAHHMFSEPDRPSVHAPALGAAAEAIVMRLLEKEPDARFPSAADLVAALTSPSPAGPTRLRASAAPVSSALPIAVAAPSMIATPGARKKRNVLPLIAASITVALAAAVVVLIASGRSQRDTAAPASQDEAAPVPIPHEPVAPVAPVVVAPTPVESTVAERADTAPQPAEARDAVKPPAGPRTGRKPEPRPAVPASRPPRDVPLPATRHGSPIETTL